MIENMMNKMGGAGVVGVISVCLFFAVFAGVIWWTFRLKQPYLKTMQELPLDGAAAPESDGALTANPKEQHD